MEADAGVMAVMMQVFTGRPATGTKEISTAEYNATPVVYLQHPDRHPTARPKVWCNKGGGLAAGGS